MKALKLQFAPVINVGSKTTQLGLFNFRAFLNIGMLLTESERAKTLRSMILDFVIATIHEKTGGGTKFINRRDINYIPAAITEENYRKNLTSVIRQYVLGQPSSTKQFSRRMRKNTVKYYALTAKIMCATHYMQRFYW